MLVLERFRKALQHRNRVLLLPTRPRDPRTQESLAPTSEIGAEEVEVDAFILMEDEKMFDAEISHIQRPSSSSSSAAWSPPTSTICDHSFLFPSEFFALLP